MFVHTVRLPVIEYDIETDNYNVLEDKRNKLIMQEAVPIVSTFAVFDECVILVEHNLTSNNM